MANVLASDPSRRRVLQGAAGMLAGALGGRIEPLAAQADSAVVTRPIPIPASRFR